MCNCGCHTKEAPKGQPAPQGENKSYVCYQCNQVKGVPASEAVPECCGKKMQEVD